jgi:hypothetical protein
MNGSLRLPNATENTARESWKRRPVMNEQDRKAFAEWCLKELKGWCSLETAQAWQNALVYARTPQDASTCKRGHPILMLIEEDCEDCNGSGSLGTLSDGRKISCESCGGHEDALGSGVISHCSLCAEVDAAQREGMAKEIERDTVYFF